MNDEVVVTARGEIDMRNAAELALAISYALRDDVKRVVVDMRSVEFCDSSGMNALVRAKQLADCAGVAFAVRSPNGVIRKSLTIGGLDQLIEIED